MNCNTTHYRANSSSVPGDPTLFALWLADDQHERSGEPLDVLGALLAVVALGSLSYGLVALGAGNRATGAIGIAASVPVTWWFIRTEAQARAPMMPLDLFDDRTFAGANALTVLLYASLSAALFLLPLLMVNVHHYSATAAGATFLPFSIIMGAGSRWSGSLSTSIGARWQLMLGAAIVAASYVILGVSGDRSSYWTGFLPGLIALAVGMTLCVPPLTMTVFDASPADKGGTASGINNAAARAGGLIAIAALGLAFGQTGLANASRSTIVGAYRSVMFAAAVLAGLSALTAALTVNRQRRRSG